MSPNGWRPSARTELNVALMMTGAWLCGALLLFAFLPQDKWSGHRGSTSDLWGVRLPGTQMTRSAVIEPADVPDAPDGRYSSVVSGPKLARSPEVHPTGITALGWEVNHPPGLLLFSSDGSFLGTVCCLGLKPADHVELHVATPANRYSLSLPADQVHLRGKVIEIGMTMHDANRAAVPAQPSCG
jgi:hypothetical protein